MLSTKIDRDGIPVQVAAQVPYWVAVLTPEERSFGARRTDPRIDTVDSSVVTETNTQWVGRIAGVGSAGAGSTHPTPTTLLAVLAATFGAWQSDRCRSRTSGVLIDIEAGDAGVETTWFPVRLPTSGDADALTAEVRRRIAAVPAGGTAFEAARLSPALARKSGAQIAFQYGSGPAVLDVAVHDAAVNDAAASDDDDSLHHSLSVTCDVSEVDGVTTVNASFRWNCRIFTRADVDDFERFWEKTLTAFV